MSRMSDYLVSRIGTSDDYKDYLSNAYPLYNGTEPSQSDDGTFSYAAKNFLGGLAPVVGGGLNYVGSLLNSMDENGRASSLSDSIKNGGPGVLHSAGDWFINNGEYLNRYGEDINQRYKNHAYEGMSIPDRLTSIDYLTDKGGLLADVTNGFGSSLPFLVGTAVTPEITLPARGVGLISSLLGRAGAKRLASAIGPTAEKVVVDGAEQIVNKPSWAMNAANDFGNWALKSGPLEAATNAGTSYNDLKNMGLSDSEIYSRMNDMVAEELPIDMATSGLFGAILGGNTFSRLGKGGLKRAVAANALSVPAEMGSEYLQEMGQQRVQNKYSGREYGTWLNPTADELEAGRVAAIGALPMALFGMGKGVRNSRRLAENPTQGGTQGNPSPTPPGLQPGQRDITTSGTQAYADWWANQLAGLRLQTPTQGAPSTQNAQNTQGKPSSNGANANLGAGTHDMPTQGDSITAQVQNLKSGWESVLPQIGGVLKNKFGMDGVISSGARDEQHNADVGGSPTSHHIDHGNGGDAVDIVLPDGTTQEQAEAVKSYFENSGAFDEVLFHDAGSGYHLHLGGLKGGLQEGDTQQGAQNAAQGGTLTKSSGNADYDAWIQQYADQYGVPANLLSSLLDVESGYNPNAQSDAGAVGIAQFMPSTAESIGIDPMNPQQAIEGAAIYLKQKYDKYGNWHQALEAYNGGDGNVGIADTEAYADKVLGGAGDITDTAQRAKYKAADVVNLLGNKMIDFAGTDMQDIEDAYAHVMDGVDDATKAKLPGMFDPQGKFINTAANRRAIASNQDAANLLHSLVVQKATELHPELSQMISSDGLISISDARKLLTSPVGTKQASSTQGNPAPHIDMAHLMDGKAFPTARLQSIVGQIENAGGNEDILFLQSLQNANGKIVYTPQTKQAILDHFGKDRIESELATLDLNEQRNAQTNPQANPAPAPQPSPAPANPQPAPQTNPAPQPAPAPQENPAPQAQSTQETAPQDAETAQAEADLADALQETPSRRFDPNIGAWVLKNPDEGQAKPYQEQPITTPAANPQTAPTPTVTPDMVQTEAEQAAEAQRVQAKTQAINAQDIQARTAELNAMKPAERKEAGETVKAAADLAGVELSPNVAQGIEKNNAGAIAHAEKQVEVAQNENADRTARENPEARADQNQNAEPETGDASERREEAQDESEVTGKDALRELSDDAIAMVKQYPDPASVPLNRFSQEEQAILRRAGIVRTLEAEDGHPYEAALSEPILEEGDRRLKESYGGKEENDGGKGNFAQNAERKEPAKTQESTEEPKAEEENKPVIGRTGKTVTVETDNGTPIEAKYRLVPQKSLVTSNLYADGAIVENPAYPQDVQPRDRTGRKELRAQTDKIATQMQPEKLGASVNLNQGAPIIRSDGVVLNGNGRTMGILHARELKNDSAKRYDKWLLDNAESFGYTKDAVRDLLKGDGHPVLVREVGDLDKATLDEVINSTTGGASMGAAEQAASDAARITSKDFAEYDPESGGDITKASNDNFVARLLRRLVPESDMNRYTDKNGSINQDGYQRVKRAMFSAAYQDASLIAKMAESMDDAIRNISNGLQAAAASVARINRKMDEGTAYKYPLAKSIADAVKKYNAIKEGKAEANVEEFVNANANALFEGYDPEAVELVKAFDEYRKSGKKVGAFLNNLVTEIERQGDPKEDEQATLLPIKKRVKTFDAIIHDAKARVEDGGQQDLFGAQQETRETKETNPQAKEAEESAPTDAEDFQSAIDTMDKNARALFDGTEGSLETVQRGIDNAITSYTNRTKTVDARRVSQLESYGREIISDLRKKAKKENASNREDAFHVKLGGVDVYVDAATLDPITKKFPRLKAYIDTILKSAKTNKGSAKKLAQLVTMNADDQATVAAGYIYNQAAVNYEAEKARGNEDIDMEATLGAARTVLSDLQKGDVSPQEAYRELDSILPETKPADLTGLEVEEAAKVKPLDLIKKAKDIYDAYASKKQKPDDALAALDEIEKGTQNENVVKRVQQIRTEIVNRSTSKYKELRKILKKYENGEDGKMPLADLMKQLHENHAYTLTSAQMNRLDEMASDIEKKSAKAKAETPVAPNDSVFGSVEDADKELFDELGINPNEEETLTAPDGIVNTKEERERIKEELRKELNKISVNPMFNPKIYELGAKLAFTYIKDGVNTVKKLIATLHEDFGDSITPWAPAIVETVRTWPQGVAFDEKKVRAIAKAVGARYESGLTTREAVQKDLKEKLGRSYDSYAPMIDAAYNGIEKFFNPETTQEVSTNGQESQPSGSASGRHESVQSEDVSEVQEGRNEPGGRGGKLSRSRTEDARGNVPASESANPAESQPAGSRPEGKRNEDAGAGNSERGHHGLAALRDDQKQPAATKTAGHDYEIKDDGPAPTTPAKRIQANLAAIKLLNQLESENRLPTPAEQEVLAAYSSWGGLTNAFKDGTKENTELRALLSKEDYDAAKRSILDAYFTPPAIVRAIWKGVSSLGFQGGRVFDPSMGVGNFFGCMPKAMRKASSLSGVELDRLSSRFAKMLYPSASVENTGFQNAHVADGSFDLVISNVPFNQTKVGKYALHNFFFAQGIDKVRPGGLMVFITSQSSLTSSGDAATMRRYLASKADLLGAFKLPSGVFKGTGTEVGTDVLVFQRRQENNRESGYGNNFQNVSTFQGSEAKVNDYFSEHPENVLGTQKLGKDQYKNDVVEVTAKKGQDTAKELEAAMAKLPHVYEPVNRTDTKPYQQKPADLKARDDEKRRDQEYFEKDGKLYQNQGETATEVPKKKQAVVKSYLGVKNALRSLFIAENDPNAKETTLDVLRKKLNAAYDAFIGKHGFLSEPKNVRLFGDDPNAGMVLALEKNVKLDGKGAKRHVTSAEKTDIFYQRTVQAVKPVTHAKNASDALLASLNHVGGVDVDYMAKLTGKSPEAVIKELGDAIYQDPTTGAYETKDEYLSGNVREKLAQAQEAAKKDARYHRNVDALKAVIPADLVSSEILVNMNAPWVPESDLNAFLEHLTGRTGDSYKGLSTHRMPNGKIEVGGLGWGGEKWASNGITLHDIIDCILNNKPIEVYNRGDHNKKLDLNKEKTDAANAAADRIRDEFQDWIWKDKEREQRLTKYYNENFNNEVSRKYNGAHLTFPGMNSLIKLRAHQKNIVWRMLQKANTLIAHCVGAGKTFEMQAAGMEMRRLGIANKPLYCVPNNIVEQFAREFQTLYPNAKLLVLKTGDDLPEVYRTKTDKTDDGRKLVEKIDVTKMTKDEREKYEAKCRARLRALTRIKTEDWDGIIMSHNMFERLPVSGETAAAYIQEEIDILDRTLKEAQARRGDGNAIRNLEQRKETLQNRLEEALNQDTKAVGIPFEELGIDQIFVDEADMFKNLSYMTTIGNVSGLVNPKSANRSTDMFVKTQWLTKHNGGRGVVFATGTPISNTMAEMYTMMRYLDLDGLKQKGLDLFDNWIRQYGDIGTGIERKPSGDGFRKVQKVKRFLNMPELAKAFRKFTDVFTREELEAEDESVKLPHMKDGKRTVIALEPDPVIVDYIKNVVPKRLKNMKGRRQMQKGDDNMLALTNDLRKLSMTDKKIDACAEQVARKFQETSDRSGAQAIFCDMGVPKAQKDDATATDHDADADSAEAENKAVYTRLMESLVAHGIPREQIAFVQEAKNKQAQDEMFQKVDNGELRVIIGSTQKMGAGTNFQHHLVAEHHLDAPWRPRDIEQREGRIIRQGNPNSEVEIFTYVVKDSFDANMWEKIKNKAAIIQQAMSDNIADRSVEDADLVTLSYADVEGAATGNPLIRKKLDADAEVAKYTNASVQFQRNQRNAKDKVQSLPAKIEQAKEIVARVENDANERTDTHGENFHMEVAGKAYDKRADADKALAAVELSSKPQDIGSIAGFKIRAWQSMEGETHVQLVRNRAYIAPKLGTASIENTLRGGIDKALEGRKADLAAMQNELKDAQEILSEENPYAEKLKAARQKQHELEQLINNEMTEGEKTGDTTPADSEPTATEEPAPTTPTPKAQATAETTQPAQSEQAATPTETQAAGLFDTSDFCHTKTGKMIPATKMLERVSTDVFRQAKSIAHTLDGSWSQFAHRFLFTSAEDRDTFVQEVSKIMREEQGTQTTEAPAQETPATQSKQSEAATVEQAKPKFVAAPSSKVIAKAKTFEAIRKRVRENLGDDWKVQDSSDYQRKIYNIVSGFTSDKYFVEGGIGEYRLVKYTEPTTHYSINKDAGARFKVQALDSLEKDINNAFKGVGKIHHTETANGEHEFSFRFQNGAKMLIQTAGRIRLDEDQAKAAHARAVEDLKREILRAFPGAKNIVGEGSRMTFTMPNGAKVEIRLKNSMHLTPEQAARERKSRGYAEDVSITVNGSEVTLGGKAFIELSKAGKKGTIYHEALHAAIDLCLTKKQKAALMKRYGGDEERMADAYRDYMLGKTHDMGKLWTLVHAIAKNIGDAIFAIREGLDAARTAREAFRQLSTGEAWGAPAPRKRSRGFSLFSRAEAAERPIDNEAARGDNEGKEIPLTNNIKVNKDGSISVALKYPPKKGETPTERIKRRKKEVRDIDASLVNAGKRSAYVNILSQRSRDIIDARVRKGEDRHDIIKEYLLKYNKILANYSEGMPEGNVIGLLVNLKGAMYYAGTYSNNLARGNGRDAGAPSGRNADSGRMDEGAQQSVEEGTVTHEKKNSVSRSETQDGFSDARKSDEEYLAAVDRYENAKTDEERAHALDDLRTMVQEAADAAGFHDAVPEQTVAYHTREGAAPKKTIKVYKVFTVSPDGSPTALFIGGTEKLPQGVWLDAQSAYHFQAANGKYYVPSTQNPYTKGGKTGASVEIPNEQVRQELIERGFLKPGSTAKKITALAYRPGWHAGTLPFFPQGGKKDASANYGMVHRENQVVFECELAADKNYTQEARSQAKALTKAGKLNPKNADLQYMPENGFYFYATNPLTQAHPELGAWAISGSLKINRALSQEECDTILKKNGMEPQAWEQGDMNLADLGYTGEQNDAARKTLAPITYDDSGNVIPLSERFNPEKNDIRYSVSEAEKSAKDFVKAANDKLKRKLGLTSDDMQIDKEQQAPNKKIGLLQKTVLSPHVVADKVALFRPLYQMATRAMDVLVHNRNRYNQKLDQALFLVNKEEKADLYDRLLQGDAEGKEWTRQELIDDGASENVADAYIAIRRLMTKAYHMVNDARRHPEPKTKTVTRSELDALKANHFVTSIDKVEDLGNGRYKVSYKEVRHYNNVYRDVTQDAINTYESDPRMEVLEAKANGRTDFDGNPLYDVTVMEGPADLTKLTGYIPHFFHEYLLRVVEKDGKTYVVGSGRTQREAVKNGEAYLKAHTLPEGATLHVQPKVFDFSRVGMSEKEYAPIMGDRDFYRMVSNLAQQNNMTVREAKEMLDGNVRLKGRHRFFGNALHRTGAEGYETNLDWVLRHYFNSAARYAAMETEFKPKAISYFERMFGKFDDDHADNALARFAKDYINDINGNPNAIEQAINDALKSSAFYRNVIVPTFGDRAALTLGNAIARKVSYLTLGLNMSSALLNLTQLVNSAAYLGDPRLIVKMMVKGRHRKYTYKELRILHETGVFSDIGLDSGSGYDQMRSHSATFGKNRFTRALSTANGVMDFIGDKSMLMFREMDAICRRGTVLAAYEKAISEGKTHAQAIAYARDINLKANFQYGVQDAANAFRRGSILSQLALQFKKYGFKELEVMADFMPGSKKTSAAQKAMFWGMYLMICGVMGIPALDWLDDVLGNDKRGYPKDAIQKWVIGHFPKRVAAAILYGLPALADINLSSRAGLADVIPTQGINFLGPTISKAVNLKRDAWDNGDFASSLRDISPGAYNLYAAYVGESRGKRGRLNDRYDSAWDKLLRAIGFRSVEESAPVDMQRILTHENAARTAEKQRAQDDYLEHPTIENAQRLRDLGIKDSTVTKEAQKKEQTREERMEGRAPKKGAEGIQSLIDFAKGD